MERLRVSTALPFDPAGGECRSPVSRILSPSCEDGRPFLSPRRSGAPRLRGVRLLPGVSNGRAVLPLFCLAPRGVCRAALVTLGAVGSYPTISSLPVPLRAIGGMLPVALSVRVPRGSRPSFSRGALPCGVRTFLKPRSRGTCGRPGSGGETLLSNRWKSKQKIDRRRARAMAGTEDSKN